MFPKLYSSIRSEADGRTPWVPAALAIVLIAWGGWFTLVPVSVRETTARARVEVANAAHPVDAPLLGRLVGIPGLVLGRTVHAGDVLVEIDSGPEQMELQEITAKVSALGPQLDAVRRQTEVEAGAIEAQRQRRRFASTEARSRYREAWVSASLAREESERSDRLLATGTIPQAEAGRRRAELRRQQAAARAVNAEVKKVDSESVANERDRQTRVVALERESVRLDGELALQNARIATLQYEIERRRIRAPASGRISEVAPLQVGSMVRPGDRIATIVATDALRVVAELSPASVFGRVREGQRARIEFPAFPWVEYGVATASVARVAGEIRDGWARVELAVIDAGLVPLQHGLPAEVAIEVDVATPAQLVLRAAGRVLAGTGRGEPR